jgi:hypothetical protein
VGWFSCVGTAAWYTTDHLNSAKALVRRLFRTGPRQDVVPTGFEPVLNVESGRGSSARHLEWKREPIHIRGQRSHRIDRSDAPYGWPIPQWESDPIDPAGWLWDRVVDFGRGIRDGVVGAFDGWQSTPRGPKALVDRTGEWLHGQYSCVVKAWMAEQRR